MSDRPATGRFVWFDLMSTDQEGSLKFYRELFGWNVSRIPVEGMGNYCLLRLGDVGVGGVVPLKDPKGIPSHWVGYVTVQDLDAAVIKIPELGGGLIVGPTEIPEVGRFAIAADPDGALFAPFTSANSAIVENDRPPLGAHCWSELMTPDPVASVKFYEELVGWNHIVKDTSIGKYTVVRRGDKDTAGMIQLPPEANYLPQWIHYIHVSDVDDSSRKVLELGGKLSIPPTDLAQLGRFSVVTDPYGATFALFTPIAAA